MNFKRILTLLLSLTLMAGVFAVPSEAAPAPGVYTAHVTTSYYNPDTGGIDDGGTANAALGEGMCRSAVAETGLVEVDKNGNVWVTIRMLLQSNCKNVAIATRTGYNSYSNASLDITAENSGNDSIDYRFRVSSAGVKMRGTMYVTPMGRDVLWYLWVDTGTMTPGSGDFVVNIDTSAPAEKHDKDKHQDKDKDKDADKAKDKDADKSTDKDQKQDSGKDPSKDIDSSDDKKDAPAMSDDASDAGGISGGMVAGILTAAVVIAAIVTVLIKRKKK